MFGIGIIMFFGDKFGFSALPVVMGVILGVIAENSFLKAYMISTSASGFLTYFFTGWINVIIITLCLFSLAYGIYSGIRGKKAQPRRRDIIVSAVVLVVGILLYCSLDVKNPLSHIFPSATIIAMTVLSVLLFIMTVIAIKRKTIIDETGATHHALSRARLIITIVLTVGYLCLLDIAGFYFTSMLFFFAFSSVIALNKKYFFDHIRSRVITSICFVAALYLIFKVILKVHTPTGFLF
jgi:putative tricarboxylic transport membrane protein